MSFAPATVGGWMSLGVHSPKTLVCRIMGSIRCSQNLNKLPFHPLRYYTSKEAKTAVNFKPGVSAFIQDSSCTKIDIWSWSVQCYFSCTKRSVRPLETNLSERDGLILIFEDSFFGSFRCPGRFFTKIVCFESF